MGRALIVSAGANSNEYIAAPGDHSQRSRGTAQNVGI